MLDRDIFSPKMIKMINLSFIRTRKTLIFAASVIALTTATALPAIPQEAEESEEPKPVLVKSTIVGDVDPSQATTVEDLTIPTDQLKFLVQPLTLEELQIEAAAWFLLLKNKVEEISITEVAIRRENAVIQQQEEAAQAVEEARTKLTEAEAALEAAESGTPEYEQATADLEAANEALFAAEQAVEELQAATEALKEDEDIQSVVEEAESEEEVTRANQALQEAEQERDKLEADSAEYRAATERIDALNVAIVDLEAAEEEVTAAVPGSPEFAEAEAAVEQARATVIQASDALIASGLAPTITTEETEVGSEEADEVLEDIAEDVGDSSQEAPGSDSETTTSEADADETPASAEDEAAAAGEAAEELEGTDETLEELAEAEADLKNQLVANVTELQNERTALIERFEVVLDEMEIKGGDTTSYRLYIDAVSGIELDLTDTEGLGVRLIGWLRSEQGGIRWGINIARFIGIVVASAILAEILAVILNRTLRRLGGVSDLFRQFLVVVTKRGVLVVGALFALTTLGISLGPILALVGGASFVLAFALQSNLGNFASGLMLLINKPFDVGDEVEIGGHWAIVESISLANTCLRGRDKHLIYLPNNDVWGNEIINHTHSEYRRLKFVLRIRFSQDMMKVLEMWKEIAENHPAVLDNPPPGMGTAPNVRLKLDHYLIVKLFAMTRVEGYWKVYTELLIQLQKQVQAWGIQLAPPLEERVEIKQVEVPVSVVPETNPPQDS